MTVDQNNLYQATQRQETCFGMRSATGCSSSSSKRTSTGAARDVTETSFAPRVMCLTNKIYSNTLFCLTRKSRDPHVRRTISIVSCRFNMCMCVSYRLITIGPSITSANPSEWGMWPPYWTQLPLYHSCTGELEIHRLVCVTNSYLTVLFVICYDLHKTYCMYSTGICKSTVHVYWFLLMGLRRRNVVFKD